MPIPTKPPKKTSSLNRSLINLIVDSLAAVSLLVMVVTGYLLKFPLPPTTNRSHTLWGMSRHEWGAIHAWAGIILVGVLLVHVILHWGWIYAMVRRRFTSVKGTPQMQRRAGWITIFALCLAAGLFAWLAQANVQDLEPPRRHASRLLPTPSIEDPMSDSILVVDFRRDVWPIFERSCISCHGPKKASSHFRVDQRASFFQKTDSDPLIVPKDAAASRLIAIFSGEFINMKSAEDHVLPAGERLLLETWINAGADWPEGSE